MEISQKTKDLCLRVANGSYTQESLNFIQGELASIFDVDASRAYCRVLLCSGLLTRVSNLKDVEPENIDAWYAAKNTLIRYLAAYPMRASKECPVYLAMVKARDSVNLI